MKKGEFCEELKKWEIPYSFVIPEGPNQQLVNRFLQSFLFQAAGDFLTQKGKQYGLESGQSTRGAKLNTLNETELDGLPTNNTQCERRFSLLDRLASTSANAANKQFEGTGKNRHITTHN